MKFEDLETLREEKMRGLAWPGLAWTMDTLDNAETVDSGDARIWS